MRIRLIACQGLMQKMAGLFVSRPWLRIQKIVCRHHLSNMLIMLAVGLAKSIVNTETATHPDAQDVLVDLPKGNC